MHPTGRSLFEGPWAPHPARLACQESPRPLPGRARSRAGRSHELPEAETGFSGGDDPAPRPAPAENSDVEAQAKGVRQPKLSPTRLWGGSQSEISGHKYKY